MKETLSIDKKAIADLVRIKEDFNAIIESIELMGDDKFMNSFKKSKDQIKEREFTDWNAL